MTTEMNPVATTRPDQRLTVGEWRVITVGVLGVITYAVASTASKGFCPGGVDGDGGFINADGNPTDAAPMCLNLTLQPSWLVIVLVALLVIGTIWASRRGGASAAMTLMRGMVFVIVVLVAALLVTHVAFWSYPVSDWRYGDPVSFPVPLNVKVAVTELQVN
jgi:hypothetical protein